ncbi:hypothetical protein AFA_12280 [Alcaligenes faecalis]|uniref:Uncharacterized protein n=1 Tax=Alcaligenes faecalis TaxID=511 RepID=A0AB33CUC0_ALCFA|nr:hypothetical protein AFA_12280 [Alcaligenes faecalis]
MALATAFGRKGRFSGTQSLIARTAWHNRRNSKTAHRGVRDDVVKRAARDQQRHRRQAANRNNAARAFKPTVLASKSRRSSRTKILSKNKKGEMFIMIFPFFFKKGIWWLIF